MSESTLPEAVARVVAAINDADIEAFVDAFTTDGVVNDWGRVLTGPDGVRSWGLGDAIGVGAQMTVVEHSTDGDVSKVTFDWRSSVFNGRSDVFVTVRDGKVSEFRIPPSH